MGSGLERIGRGALAEMATGRGCGEGATGSFQREVTPLKGLQDHVVQHGIP